jgi:aminodeoxyfutalosine synthase
MAGSEEQTPAMSTKQLVELIKAVGRHPIERDTLYNPRQDYKNYDFETENLTQKV